MGYGDTLDGYGGNGGLNVDEYGDGCGDADGDCDVSNNIIYDNNE
jgi:hypothetical protein